MLLNEQQSCMNKNKDNKKIYYFVIKKSYSLKKTIMGFIKEFKDFAIKGNIVDLAVAVVIGGAFGAIISSLVEDVITPLLLAPALKAVGATDIAALTWGSVKYGSFLAAIIKFLVIAMVLFGIIKTINSLKKKEDDAPAPPAEPSSTDKLLIEIRDALKK
jgi:large conductance mechanosensitive channel